MEQQQNTQDGLEITREKPQGSLRYRGVWSLRVLLVKIQQDLGMSAEGMKLLLGLKSSREWIDWAYGYREPPIRILYLLAIISGKHLTLRPTGEWLMEEEPKGLPLDLVEAKFGDSNVPDRYLWGYETKQKDVEQ